LYEHALADEVEMEIEFTQ